MFLLALALGVFVGATALAAEDVKDVKDAKDAKDVKNVKEVMHDGKVVSISGDKLVMKTGKAGKEHSHTLARDAKLILDGKPCKASDLKVGTQIRVTTRGADKQLAIRVEGLDKNPKFAASSHDGKVVSISGDKLVMTSTESKEEQTCTLTANVKVTCDGKVCKSSDLRPGMRIRVTSESDDPNSASLIEAIDKDMNFASL